MPLVTHEKYLEMLDNAKTNKFAYPAVNFTDSNTVTAAIQGFAEAESDGIIEISSGGATYAGGKIPNDPVTGSLALAAYAREVAKKYSVNIALHTDHCPDKWLDGWLNPLLEHEIAQRANGEEPSFQSHMWDGSMVPLDENLAKGKVILEKAKKAGVILEVEIGAVGGEEDDVKASANDKLYTTTEDALKMIDALGVPSLETGMYLTALTFGSVHGVIKKGMDVQLRPDILETINREVGEKIGKDHPLYLVFHGSSGSSQEDIKKAVANGIVKMNVDTDCQYAFTSPIAEHMKEGYEEILGLNGLDRNKSKFDPRKYNQKGVDNEAKHVASLCELLGSAGKSLH
jgi:fructose-bisphosphate aldolase class II